MIALQVSAAFHIPTEPSALFLLFGVVCSSSIALPPLFVLICYLQISVLLVSSSKLVQKGAEVGDVFVLGR